MTIGCLIANLICSTWQDWVFGTLATLIAAVLSRRLRHNLYLAALMPVVSNALIVGIMLYLMFGGSWWLNILTVGAGEALACFVLGIPLVKALEKVPKLYE